MCVEREMPKYQGCTKVYALKVKKVDYDCEKAVKENRDSDGTAMVTSEEEGYAPFKIKISEVKHSPKEGEYYVVFHDGYKAFMPASLFERIFAKL